ncbi:MAG: DUF4197 domain-containing protein [Proteobacteria bacterium]|nr:DUF4197 domain-containing protein [Pseudomonadota bacterium]
MKMLFAMLAVVLALNTAQAQLPKFDDKTGIAGIKETLAVGTRNAVKSLAKPDGFFANEAVKILMPEKVRRITDLASKAGYGKQVDELVLTMNRAAEAAAPVAADYFATAIREMSVEDARGILTGGNTAATDFFRTKTRDKLYNALKPIVSRKVGEVGTAKAYQSLAGKVKDIPFVGGSINLDLEDYVTNKSLDGLYTMVGQEEQKIRANPVARTTDLLKAVFGK